MHRGLITFDRVNHLSGSKTSSSTNARLPTRQEGGIRATSRLVLTSTQFNNHEQIQEEQRDEHRRAWNERAENG